jgi:hypothetical protein
MQPQQRMQQQMQCDLLLASPMMPSMIAAAAAVPAVALGGPMIS